MSFWRNCRCWVHRKLLKLLANDGILVSTILAIYCAYSHKNTIKCPIGCCKKTRQITTLAAATGLVTLFGPRDLGIAQMTLKNSRVPYRCSSQLGARFHSHLWIKTSVIPWKHWNPGKIAVCFLARMTIKLNGWPWKNTMATYLCPSSTPCHRHMGIEYWNRDEICVFGARVTL